MIIVTGATGHLGRAVVERLLDRLPADRIAATARDPGSAAALAARGVRVRAGDFAEPAGLPRAFEGAGRVLVISVNQLGEPAHRMHAAAIRAAREAGAGRVLYTSHMGARAGSPFAPASDHAAAEAVLAEGGPFTALRHGFYAESGLHMVGADLAAGELRAPEDGPVSWTARDDLAEADAAILADDGHPGGVTPPLTATEAFTLADLARAASEILGREVRRVTVSDDAWRDARVAAGLPEAYAEMYLGFYRAARRGDFAATDPTLAALLGRPPLTMRDVLARALVPAEPAAGAA